MKPSRRHWRLCTGISLAAVLVVVAGCSSSPPSTSAAAGTSAAATSSGGSSGNAQGKLAPLTIATIGNYTGGGTESATDGAEAGITAWAKWVNAHGGVAGHQVNLIVKDDQSNPAASVSDVQSLVQNDHVIALVMAFEAATEAGWASYVQQQDIPVVGGDLNTPTWITNPMFFPEGTTVDKLISAGMYAAKKNGDTSAGYIVCANIAACTQAAQAAKGVAPSYGVHFVYTGTVLPSAASYTSQCLAAKQAGAKAIGFGVDPNTGIRVAQDCAAQGYNPTYLIASQSVASSMQTIKALNGMRNVYTDFPWFANTTQAEKDYHAAMAQYATGYSPAVVNSASATQGWVSGELFAAAAQAAGFGNIANPTNQDVLRGLYALHGDTLGGLAPPLTFAKGKPSPSVGCFFLGGLDSGQFDLPFGGGTFCV